MVRLMTSTLFGPGLKPGFAWKQRFTQALKNLLPGLKSGASTRRLKTIDEKF